ncbi:hypothetical protein HNQ44_002828 [Planomicrobium koreense]|uniref:DUF3219 domain-containing protein n=1 Tax=Planococcus koreensis TaxID=112331 RepID=A0A7W8CTI8_9BACL|nr:DUF3219 family protein [Planococcus koreensis]MBB5181363.1 hypothetical protein [Planococcus koreensis]
MGLQIQLNDQIFDALSFSEESTTDSASQELRRKIIFDFKVTSENYHDVAVLLYEMEFHVRIPEKDLDFQASISNYSTSVTNLYLDGQVADYHLELIEKP